MKVIGKPFLLLLLFISGWYSIGTEFWLAFHNPHWGTLRSFYHYFSFFTIQSNILIALAVTFQLSGLQKSRKNFLVRPSVQTALTVYILVVGLVFNLVLRKALHLQGQQKFLNDILHTVVPALYLIFWLIYVPKATVMYSNIWYWMIYPAVYCLYLLVGGHLSGFYPYPFMNVAAHGLAVVIRNSGVLVLVFYGFSVALVAVARFMAEPEKF